MLPSIKTLARVVTIVLFVVASASDAVTAIENPCKADRKRLSGDVKPGRGRIRECLKAHKDELSPESRNSAGKKQPHP